MPFGWMGRILEIDLTDGITSYRETMPYAHDFIGGRAMASRIAWDEIPPSIDPYDRENRIIIATGPLTGTLSPTSSRTVMGSLSPRVYPTPWYTHSTLGGWFGPELKYAGFDAIVIRGKADSPVYLEVQDDKARLVQAKDLWGLDTKETQLMLIQRTGPRTQVMAIGPAGENLVRFATVQHAEENAAGHSGFGAVWGSKNLKAIAVVGSRGVSVADPDALLREVLGVGKYKVTPCTDFLRGQDETTKHRPVCSQTCTFNCQVGGYSRASDGRLMPSHCIGRVWVSESGLEGTEYTGDGMRVPPGRNFGLSEEVSLHELCNCLGLDLWFRLVMQPWLIRCKQLGVHEIRGFPLEPEDSLWFEGFMRQLAERRGLGDIFAEDLRRAMDGLEGDLPDELIGLGRELEFNFGFPAHREGRFWDGEPLPFWVISAMMHAGTGRDPAIGSHQSSLLLAEFLLADRELARRQFRRLSGEVWGNPDALEPTFENKAPVAIWSENQLMLVDSLPLCGFAFPRLVRSMDCRETWQNTEDIAGDLDLHIRLFAAVTGLTWTREEMTRVAERAFSVERAMLARAGRRREMDEALGPHFMLPCKSDGTRVDEAGFSQLLDEYYSGRGWDLGFGWPQESRLRALGLADVAAELGERRRLSL